MAEWFGWDIRREGRAWQGAEARRRWQMTPQKLEMLEGKLLSSDEERTRLLGLLLENMGADQAVRLGDPNVWIEAAEALKQSL